MAVTLLSYALFPTSGFFQTVTSLAGTTAARVTALSSGGFASVAQNGAGHSGAIYSADNVLVAPIAMGTGGVPAVDQLANGNLVIVSQGTDDLILRFVNSQTGANIGAATPVVLPGISAFPAVT